MQAGREAPGEAAQHSRLLIVPQGEWGWDFHCKDFLLPGKPTLTAAASHSIVRNVLHPAFPGV